MKSLIPKKIFSGNVNKALLVLNVIMAFVYIGWWFLPGHVGNPSLYAVLFIGEIYHLFMAITFWMTIWPNNKRIRKAPIQPETFYPSVDVYITVAGEPLDIIRQTINAAKNIDYKAKKIYVLNDNLVIKNDDWKDVERLAKELKVNCITRTVAGGAKAGNINHALTKTKGEIVVIFDADMKPYPEFLKRTLPYFVDRKVGFVQTPQYYSNHATNEVSQGSWEQQSLFFGPIMQGKDRWNAAFICGTNVAIRRTALVEVGGMCEDNIAEDFLTSLSIHQNGWKSHYIRDVLSEGLAPEDMLSYYKQQLRWARGSLEVLFGSNPLFKKGLSWGQKMQYLSSGMFYLNGIVVLIDITMPLVFLFFGLEPVSTTTMTFAIFFIPFMFLNLYTLYIASGKDVTFKAISFSQSSWALQLTALFSVLMKQKMTFVVTPKQAQEGNFLFLAYPHLAYIFIAILATIVGIYNYGLNSSVSTNVAWILFNILLFIPFINASYKWNKLFENIIPQRVRLAFQDNT